MKSEFQARLLQHMVQKKKQDEGFTLIELLVVIIIIGILAAIALPSFLNQANKAKESESKTYVGSMNRTQQAYLLENTKFTDKFDDLGLGIPTSTANYTYAIEGVTDKKAAGVSYPIDNRTSLLRTHTGGVQVVKKTGTNESTSRAILCQSKSPKKGEVTGVTFGDDETKEPVCLDGTYESAGK